MLSPSCQVSGSGDTIAYYLIPNGSGQWESDGTKKTAQCQHSGLSTAVTAGFARAAGNRRTAGMVLILGGIALAGSPGYAVA
jgi:hypothetical protein